MTADYFEVEIGMEGGARALRAGQAAVIPPAIPQWRFV